MRSRQAKRVGTTRTSIIALMVLLVGSTWIFMLKFINITQQEHDNPSRDIPRPKSIDKEGVETKIQQMRQELTEQHRQQVHQLEETHRQELSQLKNEQASSVQSHQQQIQDLKQQHQEQIDKLKEELERLKSETEAAKRTSKTAEDNTTPSPPPSSSKSEQLDDKADSITSINVTTLGGGIDGSDGNSTERGKKWRPANFTVSNFGIAANSVPLPKVDIPTIFAKRQQKLYLGTQKARNKFGYSSPSCTLQLDDGEPINRIVFMHMRKAGGSSLRNYFRRVARDNKLAFMAEEGYIAGEFPGNVSKTLYITHWREPIARAVSHYKYEERWDCVGQLKKKDFVPMYNNTKMSLSQFATKEWRKRRKFWRCSNECMSRWVTFSHNRKILKDKEYLEKFARETFGGYHLIIITEWLKIPEYAHSLETMFGLSGINQFAGMMCREKTIEANTANPLVITEEDMDLLKKGNEVDLKLYKEYTTCPSGGPQFVHRKLNFVAHEAGFGYNSDAAVVGDQGGNHTEESDEESEQDKEE